MNIQAYIENLRDRPEHIRRRYAFWSSFGVTAVVFAFWLGSISGADAVVKQSVAAVAAKTSSPAQSLVAGIGALGQDVWQIIFGPKKITYSEVQITPGRR